LAGPNDCEKERERENANAKTVEVEGLAVFHVNAGQEPIYFRQKAPAIVKFLVHGKQKKGRLFW